MDTTYYLVTTTKLWAAVLGDALNNPTVFPIIVQNASISSFCTMSAQGLFNYFPVFHHFFKH